MEQIIKTILDYIIDRILVNESFQNKVTEAVAIGLAGNIHFHDAIALRVIANNDFQRELNSACNAVIADRDQNLSIDPDDIRGFDEAVREAIASALR